MVTHPVFDRVQEVLTLENRQELVFLFSFCFFVVSFFVFLLFLFVCFFFFFFVLLLFFFAVEKAKPP